MIRDAIRVFSGALLASTVACSGGAWAYDPLALDEPFLCDSDASCGSGRVCRQDSGRCVECVIDSDCGVGAGCVESVCRTAPGRCRVDADCPSGSAGRCDPAGARCVACLDADDCGGAPAVCQAGTCREVPACDPAPANLRAQWMPVVTLEPGGAAARTEATVGAWEACVEAGCCPARPASRWTGDGSPDPARVPANMVSYPDAVRFCRWMGGHVPSAAEWTRLVRSAGGPYPWGSEPPVCSRAVVAQSKSSDSFSCGRGPVPAAVCSLSPDEGSPCDVVGNLWEWTSESSLSGRVARGGGFDITATQLDALERQGRGLVVPASTASPSIGVRCGFDPGEVQP